MIDSARQATATQPTTQPQACTPTSAAASPYAQGWNPPAAAQAKPELPKPESQGFLDRLGSAFGDGDVRGMASTLRDGIGDATEAGKSGITSAVGWTGETIGKGADFARSQISGDDVVSSTVRDAVTGLEQNMRFGVGFTGGVLREGVGLLGTVGELGTTLTEGVVSAEARDEYTGKIVDTVGSVASASARYVGSVADDPSRLGSDAGAVWDSGSGFVSRTVDRYEKAAAEGRMEEIGLDVGAVATYVVPVGGGPARALLGGSVRGAEGAAARTIAEGGATLAARTGDAAVSGVVREAGATSAVANDVAPMLTRADDLPQLRPAIENPALQRLDLHDRAQMADSVYGRSTATLPANAVKVSDAAALAKINLSPDMLSRGAFKADVYRSTAADGSEAYTVAFRGTRPSDVRDLFTDGAQAVGLPTSHYNRALEIGRAVGRIDDPAINVVFTGHSLGGGLAAHAANAAGREAVTFNAAGLHAASIARGDAVAAELGRIDVPIQNFIVPGEALTATQDAIGFLPKAFGETIELPLVVPEGAGFLAQQPPLSAISRHGMNWVLASTAALRNP